MGSKFFPSFVFRKSANAAQVCLAFMIMFIWGCAEVYNSAGTGNNEFYFINDKQETAIGKAIARDIIKNNKLIRDKKELSYVRKIGRNIVQASSRNYLNYNFYVLDNDGMEAFSLPGGFIFLSYGIIEKTTKDELAFAIGHEVGHICARHPIKLLQDSLGTNAVMKLASKGAEDSLLNKAVDIVYNTVSLGYSYKDELLADSLAVKYTYNAGYNPEAGVSLMKKLREDKKNGYTFIFLHSHPPINERIKNIKEEISVIKERR